jgi:hypothetical protein
LLSILTATWSDFIVFKLLARRCLPVHRIGLVRNFYAKSDKNGFPKTPR